MAAIKNLNGLTVEQVNDEISRGGRFVMYQYTISLIVITLHRSSDIYFIPAGEKSIGQGFPFTLVSLVFGWWGLPWGPIRTLSSIGCNLSGGKNITQEVMSLMDSLDTSKRVTRKVA
jgi:hypothetical protein